MAPYHMAIQQCLPDGTTWHPAMAPYHGTRHPAMAPCNPAAHVQSVKVRHNHPLLASGTQQWHLSMAATVAPYHGTQQWYLTMAPSNGTIPWHPAMAPYHGIQQWHRTMARTNGNTSSLPKCVIPPPPHLLHLAMVPYIKWHPAMAPYHGTLPHGT